MSDFTSLALKVERDRLWVLDQTLLPHKELWADATRPETMIPLIQCLAVRGAPLIGVAAALSLGLSAKEYSWEAFELIAKRMAEARPTAVNLRAAVLCLLAVGNVEGWQEKIKQLSFQILHEDVELCERLANRGAALIQDGENILTHCNSGALATAGVGTALGVIRRAHELGKKIHVFVDETRPLWQGARLTAWELEKLNIPYTLICDNMAGSLMQAGRVQRVFTGADRIAANGDAANKIGTYPLAVLAFHHRVPFYIVAPRTTVDEGCPTGKDIPIEERAGDEVRAEKAPARAQVWNPAFDVTPRELITELIVE